MAVAAVGVALFTVITFVIGTWWSFAACVAVTSTAYYIDRQRRPDPDQTSLLAYVLLIYLASAVVLGMAGAVLGILVLVLP